MCDHLGVRRLVLWFLRVRGWRFEGETPSEKRYVVCGAPHTSNWDFILFLGAVAAFDLPARYIGKHTLFRWPLGALMRRWGGIPVDRSAAAGIVQQVADAVMSSDESAIVIAPEGTRAAAEFWKTGFYRIAEAAGVPILLGYDDWDRKVVGLGPLIQVTGDIRADMGRIRAFYEPIAGKDPAKQGPIRLKEEE